MSHPASCILLKTKTKQIISTRIRFVNLFQSRYLNKKMQFHILPNDLLNGRANATDERVQANQIFLYEQIFSFDFILHHFIQLITLIINSAWRAAAAIFIMTPPWLFLLVSGFKSQLWNGKLINFNPARPWIPNLPVRKVIVCFSSLYLISCMSFVDQIFRLGIQCATNGGSNQRTESGSL